MTLLVNSWEYVGSGYLTNADVAPALAAAAAARERRPADLPH